MTEPTYIYRIHIRPQGGSANAHATFQYCLDQEVLGVGWRVSGNLTTAVPEEYLQLAKDEHPEPGALNQVAYMQRWIKPNDLAWTRDADGNYYLARATSRWLYLTTERSRVGSDANVDIGNVFRCEILKVQDTTEVPGKVIASFRPTRTIQEIQSPTVAEYTKHLWNKLSGAPVYEIDRARFTNIFALLDAEEAEDLVFLYLQTKGMYVLPNSRKGDTMAYEFLAIDAKPPHSTFKTQVKTGHTEINTDDYAEDGSAWFLFQAENLYRGQSYPHVTTISPQEMLDFMNTAKAWLPKAIRYKLQIIEKAQSAL